MPKCFLITDYEASAEIHGEKE